MNIDQFIKALAECDVEWVLIDHARIRSKQRYNVLEKLCPITAVYLKSPGGKTIGSHQFNTAAKKLGLLCETAFRIACASDASCKKNEDLLKLRRRLLKACGLKKEGKPK